MTRGRNYKPSGKKMGRPRKAENRLTEKALEERERAAGAAPSNAIRHRGKAKKYHVREPAADMDDMDPHLVRRQKQQQQQQQQRALWVWPVL